MLQGATTDGDAGAADGRTLILKGAGGRTAMLVERPAEGTVEYSRMPRLEFGEGLVLMRAGTCGRRGSGAGYHLPPGGTIRYRYDTLRRSTFSIESFSAAGALAPSMCVEHRGRSDLPIWSAPAGRVLRGRRVSPDAIVAQAPGLRVTLRRIARGTTFKIVAAEGGSGGTFGHLRRGTCTTRPTAAEIPLRVVYPGIDVPTLERPVQVALPFASFGNGRYVVEVHAENAGARVTQCVVL